MERPSMDRLESMSIVLAVAEAGSLAAAVRRLNTPPATASRKITELEEHLRTKLFDRSARRLVLTDAGSSYVAGLKRILADISEIERATSGEYTAPAGELVVTAPVGLGRIHLVPIWRVPQRLSRSPCASSWATASSASRRTCRCGAAPRRAPRQSAHGDPAWQHLSGRVRQPSLSGLTRNAGRARGRCWPRLHSLREFSGS